MNINVIELLYKIANYTFLKRVVGTEVHFSSFLSFLLCCLFENETHSTILQLTAYERIPVRFYYSRILRVVPIANEHITLSLYLHEVTQRAVCFKN
jgi:hypothetical protein